MKTFKLPISRDAFLYVRAIHYGILSPLEGFCDLMNYRSITKDMRLSDGRIWPLPITLEIPEDKIDEAKKTSSIDLIYPAGRLCARLLVSDVFELKADSHIKPIFGTDDTNHPGVNKELKRSRWRVGGKIIAEEIGKPISGYFKTPKEVKDEIANRRLKTIAGFQTRNPIHRAHEYLQTVALNVCDGILIQPQIGWLKKGDFSIKAILGAYDIMMRKYYNDKNVIFSTLELPMNYAGPKEAVLHALIRKNYGCTHFIVGRDHAGVHNFYGRYEAQELAAGIKDLGVHILALKSPFYCSKCGLVTTEKSCRHYPGKHISHISGVDIRECLNKLKPPAEYAMRKEISSYLLDLSKKKEAFITDE